MNVRRSLLRHTLLWMIPPVLLMPPTAIAGATIAPSLASPTARAANTSRCTDHAFNAPMARRLLDVARLRVHKTVTRLSPGQFPNVSDRDWTWQTTTRHGWTSGFFPGALWLLYDSTRHTSDLRTARAWTEPLAPDSRDETTHDVGFQIMTSFGEGLPFTHSPAYRRTIMTAAHSLAARYNPTVGAIRSWGPIDDNAHFEVIVDNMMNLNLLFWAGSHSRHSTWTTMATRHADTTLRKFVRPNGSVIHLVDFNPASGEVQGTANPQGYSPESTWSRGQSWAIYGFTTAYEYTHKARFLMAARHTAAYYWTHLPADCVPYWDFDDPAIPDAPKDSAAAAVAAEGLTRLAHIDPDPRRRARDSKRAASILWSLESKYIATGGEALLRGATPSRGFGPANVGTPYGDYYAIKADLQWLGYRFRF